MPPKTEITNPGLEAPPQKIPSSLGKAKWPGKQTSDLGRKDSDLGVTAASTGEGEDKRGNENQRTGKETEIDGGIKDSEGVNIWEGEKVPEIRIDNGPVADE